MRVNLHEVEQSTMVVATHAEQCDLSECFPDDPEETARVAAVLEDDGWCYVGGGAAQMYLITIAKPITSAQSQAYIDGVHDWWTAGQQDAPPEGFNWPAGDLEIPPVDDGDYIAERIAQRDDEPPTPYD